MKGHGNDYYIRGPELACIGAAKLQPALLYFLCKDGGKRAKEIKAGYAPRFRSKETILLILTPPAQTVTALHTVLTERCV